MILSPATWFSSASLLTAAAYVLAALWPQAAPKAESSFEPSKASPMWGRALLMLAWLAHLLLIASDAVDWRASPLTARFGFAPAVSFTMWMVLAVYAVERLQPESPVARRTLALLAGASVLLAGMFPGQVHPSQHTLAPLHWALGLASYGLFGAALLHATFLRVAERRLKMRLPPAGLPLLKLESLTFKFVATGFAVLTATLVLGYAFARPWHWDHKSVFSVLAWLVFATLLAGRHWMGWRGRTATGWLYAGSLLLLLAYVGSRFVLEVLLHRQAAA